MTSSLQGRDGAPIDIDKIGEDVPLLEGIRTARAIRRLRPDPVPMELIRKVCEAGTFAPSGGNRQPWRFIAVTEPERRAWIAERYLSLFRVYIAPAFEQANDPNYPAARLRREERPGEPPGAPATEREKPTLRSLPGRLRAARPHPLARPCDSRAAACGVSTGSPWRGRPGTSTPARP